jgi:DNA-binding NtrC family response regulator
MQSSRVVDRVLRKRPVLWIVDSEQWPRACLRAELIERGYDAIGFIALNDAIETLSQEAGRKPDAILIESRDQDLTKEILETIEGLNVPTLLLAGTFDLANPVVQQHYWTKILTRPFSLGRVSDIVQELVPVKHSRAREL